MQRDFFIQLEGLESGSVWPLDAVIGQLAFNEQGLIPVITQDETTQEVLMFAWMNLDALAHTLKTGRMTYWSRSRGQLWKKGETSGHTQMLVHMSFDCDGDAVLCKVKQTGGACHTGRRNCFYLHVNAEQGKVIIQGDPQQ